MEGVMEAVNLLKNLTICTRMRFVETSARLIFIVPVLTQNAPSNLMLRNQNLEKGG